MQNYGLIAGVPTLPCPLGSGHTKLGHWLLCVDSQPLLLTIAMIININAAIASKLDTTKLIMIDVEIAIDFLIM